MLEVRESDHDLVPESLHEPKRAAFDSDRGRRPPTLRATFWT